MIFKRFQINLPREPWTLSDDQDMANLMALPLSSTLEKLILTRIALRTEELLATGDDSKRVCANELSDLLASLHGFEQSNS